MTTNKLSTDLLAEASREQGQFSGHGNAAGAAGLVADGEAVSDFLHHTGEVAVINPQDHGYGDIRITAAWDNVKVEGHGLIDKVVNTATHQGVDLDLGCLYELQDGTRGAVQAFGDMFGGFDQPPHIALAGDEREGGGETIRINGHQWPAIRRILVYAYIYEGVPDWAALKPRVTIAVPGEEALVTRCAAGDSKLPVCAIAGIENVRNGMKITNYTEYFAGHAEMDRAFGFGVAWVDGQKQQ